MNAKKFQEVSHALLQKHYGLHINDTYLSEDRIVEQCVAQRFRPFQIVAEHAQEAGLERIDISGPFGTPCQAAITSSDEDLVLIQLGEPTPYHSGAGQ